MIAMRQADPIQSALAENEAHSADGSPGTYLQDIKRRETITGEIHLDKRRNPGLTNARGGTLFLSLQMKLCLPEYLGALNDRLALATGKKHSLQRQAWNDLSISDTEKEVDVPPHRLCRTRGPERRNARRGRSRNKMGKI